MQFFRLYTKLFKLLFKHITFFKLISFRDLIFISSVLAKFVHFPTVSTSRPNTLIVLNFNSYFLFEEGIRPYAWYPKGFHRSSSLGLSNSRYTGAQPCRGASSTTWAPWGGPRSLTLRGSNSRYTNMGGVDSYFGVHNNLHNGRSSKPRGHLLKCLYNIIEFSYKNTKNLTEYNKLLKIK